MIKIDKGIPIPDYRHGPTKYPWRDLEVGDSFLVSKPNSNPTNANKRYHPKKFIGRKVEDGYRIWRVE